MHPYIAIELLKQYKYAYYEGYDLARYRVHVPQHLLPFTKIQARSYVIVEDFYEWDPSDKAGDCYSTRLENEAR